MTYRTGRMPVIEKENTSMDTNEDADAMMTMHEFRIRGILRTVEEVRNWTSA